jgi:hypothetical protein
MAARQFWSLLVVSCPIRSSSGLASQPDQPATKDKDGMGGIVCTGVIPSTVLDPSDLRVARIAFQVARTVAPATLDLSSGDTRQLGVALSWIEIAPADL